MFYWQYDISIFVLLRTNSVKSLHIIVIHWFPYYFLILLLNDKLISALSLFPYSFNISYTIFSNPPCEIFELLRSEELYSIVLYSILFNLCFKDSIQSCFSKFCLSSLHSHLLHIISYIWQALFKWSINSFRVNCSLE